jgi:hypothetical protein
MDVAGRGGASQREIERVTGISRKTIRTYQKRFVNDPRSPFLRPFELRSRLGPLRVEWLNGTRMRQGKGMEFWKVHVEAQQRLGQSRSAYAAKHGLSVHSLRWWARKLGPTTPRQATSSASAPNFVALRLAPGAAPAEASRCTLRCDGGWQLECPSLPPPQWLAELGRAIQRRER